MSTPVFNSSMREYTFDIVPKLDNGQTPKVLNDEVKSIKDIKVWMRMASENSVSTDELVEIGTMNLSIDDTQPILKFDTITLESAFNNDSGLNHKDMMDVLGSPQINNEKVYVEDISTASNSKFDIKMEYDSDIDASFPFISYTGAAKNFVLQFRFG